MCMFLPAFSIFVGNSNDKKSVQQKPKSSRKKNTTSRLFVCEEKSLWKFPLFPALRGQWIIELFSADVKEFLRLRKQV